MEGHRLFREGQHDEAFAAFRKSARYADKAAQAMIGEMLWDGLGVPADRVQAYIWMDLAAERGYRNFVVLRERYWARMSEAEREAAVEGGAPIYQEFVAMGRQFAREFADEIGASRQRVLLARDLRLAMMLGYLHATIAVDRYSWVDREQLRRQMVEAILSGMESCLRGASAKAKKETPR